MMTKPSSRLLLTVALGLLSLGAHTEAHAAPAPCSLLTAAEVEQIVGKLSGTPKADQEGRAGWCNYEVANGTDALEVWVFPADGIERGRSKAKKPIAVKELGEEAFFARGMHGLEYVNLFIKKRTTTIQISLKETPGDEDKAMALGKKAVGRM